MEWGAWDNARSGEAFLRLSDYPVYGVLTGIRLFMLGYALYLFFSHLTESGFLPIAVISVPLLLPAFFDQMTWFSLLAARRAKSSRAPHGLRVAAVTTFVPQSEAIEMLERTVASLTAMAYDHDTWVLDEGDEPRVRELCGRLGARHFSRKGNGQFQSESGRFQRRTKHGNYNAWLESVGFEQYDFIANFDPDHIPQPEFLDVTLGHFDDPQLGYVQAAQAYYNQDASFVARGAAEETYGYYSIVQAAASRFGYPVVTGCHTTHRVRALREVHGFAAHLADDVLITSNYRRCGWRGLYLPRILARGLAPVSWRSYVDQQRRWAGALLDIKLRQSFSSQRAQAIIQALQGIRYFLDGLSVISFVLLTMLLFAGKTAVLPVLGITAELFFVFFLTNLYKQRFYLDPTTECGIPWRAYLLRLVKWPYTCAAIFDVIGRHQSAYNTTRKDNVRELQPAVMLPQFVVALAIALAWATSSITGHIVHPTIHLLGAFAVALPLGAAATGLTRFPTAYDSNVSPPSPYCRILNSVELLAGFSLAIFFLLWPLRLIKGTVALQDSARHLMNGVFVYDLFRTGHIFHPIDFARLYFAHFPALSMPYHPPLFPAFEALLFAIVDPKFGAARLAIAIAVSLSAYLLYRLVLINSGSAMIAGAVCSWFLFLGLSRYLEVDIMLEFPALVFVLAAMLSLQSLGKDGFSWSQGLTFGLWAAAAVWTKQAIFVALVPFLYFLLLRSRRPFTRPGIWIGAAVSGLSALLLLHISAKVGLLGIPHNWAPMSLSDAIDHNAFYYLHVIPVSMVFLALGTAAAAVWFSFRTSTNGSETRWMYLYIAWALSALTVVLMAPAFELRYLFFAFPPVLALACESVYRLLRIVLPPLMAAALIAVAVAVFCGLQAFEGPIWLTGPEIAAGRLGASGIKSAIYLGSSNGAFIFETRLLHPDLQPVVFRGDKVLQGALSRERLEELAHTYGANAVAIESLRSEDMDWQLILRDSRSLRFWFRQEIESSLPYMRGRLFVFRVSDPSLTPRKSIRERIDILGREEVLPLADR